jgi:acyl dehydratase
MPIEGNDDHHFDRPPARPGRPRNRIQRLIEVPQTVIDEFAEATRDAQWIHVDSERAARESPFRDNRGQRYAVAHGFLTLSLLTYFIESCLRVTGARAGINIGFDRVRFVSPVPAGSQLRGRFAPMRFEDLRAAYKSPGRSPSSAAATIVPR